jgi:3',5'-cyclic AMP phosphodiesterase CpdA
MLITQITDTHITEYEKLAQDRVDTYLRLGATVHLLNGLSMKPDVVLITGDLADDRHTDSYKRLLVCHELLTMPYYLMPGNHDDRGLLRYFFPNHPGMSDCPFIQYAVDDCPVLLIGINTVVEGSDFVLLGEKKLLWLDNFLNENTEKPILIFIHHPPFKTGIDEIYFCALEGVGDFRRIVKKHSQIKHILCGHLHRSIQTQFTGVPVAIAPSTAYSQVLGLGDNCDKGFVVGVPKYKLHLWMGEAFVSHVVTLEDIEGPSTYPLVSAS